MITCDSVYFYGYLRAIWTHDKDSERRARTIQSAQPIPKCVDHSLEECRAQKAACKETNMPKSMLTAQIYPSLLDHPETATEQGRGDERRQEPGTDLITNSDGL